jgi:hypothetical protein
MIANTATYAVCAIAADGPASALGVHWGYKSKERLLSSRNVSYRPVADWQGILNDVWNTAREGAGPIALYAAVVSTITLVWNAVRDILSLRIRAQVTLSIMKVLGEDEASSSRSSSQTEV